MKKLYAAIIAVSFFTSPLWAQNYVLDMDGTSAYVDVGNSAGNSIRTMECWFKLNSLYDGTQPNAVSLIARNDATQFSEFGLYLSNFPGEVGNLVFFRRISGTLYNVYSNASSWSAGVWYHVAGVIDPSAGMKLYINGALQTDSDPSALATSNATEMTALGDWGDALIRYLPGRLDEVRFWSRALSQSEIQQKMCFWLNPLSEVGLVAYWKLNEGSGVVANDATGNGYNGSIFNAIFVNEVNCFTGIEETGNEVSISVSPNPSSGVFSIKASAKINSVEVMNVLGEKMVLSHASTPLSMTLDLSAKPKGIYFVRIETEKGTATKKIIIH